MYVMYMCTYIHNHIVYLRYTIRYFADTEMERLIGKHIVAADNLVRSTRSVNKTKMVNLRVFHKKFESHHQHVCY